MHDRENKERMRHNREKGLERVRGMRDDREERWEGSNKREDD